MTYVYIDSLLRRVYGKRKQGASFGHTKVGGHSVRLRGLSPLVATICTPIAAPVVAAMRLRKGSAGSSRGAASLLTEALATTHAAGAAGPILVRADSAFYAGMVKDKNSTDALFPLWRTRWSGGPPVVGCAS